VILAIGMKEVEERNVSLRRLGEKQTRVVALDEVVTDLAAEATPPTCAEASAQGVGIKQQGGLRVAFFQVKSNFRLFQTVTPRCRTPLCMARDEPQPVAFSYRRYGRSTGMVQLRRTP